MNVLLIFFLIGLCSVVFFVLLDIAPVLLAFRWGTALKKLRYSLTTLLALMIAIAVAFGITRLQDQSNSLLSMPLPLALLFCLMLLAFFAIVKGEFRTMYSTRSTRRSTLDSYRSRQYDRIQQISIRQSEATTGKTESARQRARGKWWLRRMPNRFRSISHRDFQVTPGYGYNNRND